MAYHQLPVTQFNPDSTDLTSVLGKVLQLKNLMQQNQMGQQNLEQQQLQTRQQKNILDEHDAAMQAIQQAGSAEAALPELQRVAPEFALKVQKEAAEFRNKSLDQQIKTVELKGKNAARTAQIIGSSTDPASFQQNIQAAQREGSIDPETAQGYLQAGFSPENVQRIQSQAMSAKEQLDHSLDVLKRQDAVKKQEEEHRHNVATEGQGKSDTERYLKDYLEANNLPDTPKNRLQARQKYIKETKIDPAMVRSEVWLKMPTEVADPNSPGETVMVPRNQAAGMKGKGSASVQTAKAEQKYMTSGKGGQQLTAFNTAIAHLDTLDRLATDLKNTDLQVLNKAKQAWATETGNPAPANFEAAKNAMSGEVAAALKASGATDQEISHVGATFSRAQSPAQLKGAINTYRELLKSKAAQLKRQYDTGMQSQPAFGQDQGGWGSKFGGVPHQ